MSFESPGQERASGQRNTDHSAPTPQGPLWPGWQLAIYSPAVFPWREMLTSWNLILSYRGQMRGGILEWLSGGREAAAEARQGGGFPCLLMALALGERHATQLGHHQLCQACVPEGRMLTLSGRGEKHRTLLQQPHHPGEGGAKPGTGSFRVGPAWVSRALRGLGWRDVSGP